MTDPALHPLEMILRQCAQAGPEPWYPLTYAQSAGVPRDSLDPYLEQLRLDGWVQLTDWVKGKGQGYLLTPEGREVLDTPSRLAKLRGGRLATRQENPRAELPGADAQMTTWDRGEAIREALMSPGQAVMVRLLIAANVLWFVAGLAFCPSYGVPTNLYLTTHFSQPNKPATEQEKRESRAYLKLLEAEGAISGQGIVKGEWWRLLSHGFVHQGLLHLASNMFCIYMLGRFAEQMWGRVRFLVLFLLAVMGGAVLALVYEPFVLYSGASGGFCGLLGGAAVWILLNRQHLPGAVVAVCSRNLAINAMLLVLVSVGLEQVSATGHLGGAALGAVAGGLLNFHRFGSAGQRWLAAAGLVALPVACIGYLAYSTAHDPKWKPLREDAPVQANANELYQDYLPRAAALDKEVDQLYRTTAYPLLLQEPDQRDPQAVRDAVVELNKMRARLARMSIEFFQEAGPYTGWNEEIRRNRAHYFREHAELMDLLALRLEKGPAWRGLDIVNLEVKRATIRKRNEQLRQAPKLQIGPPRAPLPQQHDAPGGAIDAQPLPGA